MEEIIAFLEEYASFFEGVEKKQTEKLEILTQGELTGIEQSILMQQALDKQIENMEQRRMKVFQSAGYEGKTFRELIERSKDEQKSQLEVLYQRIDQSIGNIKFINQKCVKLAQTALAGMGITDFPKKSGTKGYEQVRPSSGSILQTKI